MKEKLNGIALILFVLLFCNVSDVFQAYFWKWGIGAFVPWAVIAFFIGILGLPLLRRQKPYKRENEIGEYAISVQKVTGSKKCLKS